MLRTIALTGLAALIAATMTSLVPPAQAQIGNIFCDPPLRPPGAIPRGNQQQQQIPDDDEEVPELPRGRLLPTLNRPPPGQGAPLPGNFQSQPLPPPPGTTVAPRGTQPGVAVQPPQPGQPGVANAPPGAPPPGSPAGPASAKGVPQSPATLQPGDEVVSEPPATKITNKKASFSGLDKITGRIINFDEDIRRDRAVRCAAREDQCLLHAAVDGSRQHGRLRRGRRDHAAGRSEADLLGLDVRGEPGLHGVEHPVYDIWLTDCKGPDQTIVSAQPDPPKTAAPPPAGKRPPQPKQAVPRPPGLPRSRNSSRSSRNRLLRRPLRNSGRVDYLADCSGISRDTGYGLPAIIATLPHR